MLSLAMFWRSTILCSAVRLQIGQIWLDFPGCSPRCHGKIKQKMRNCETSQLGDLSANTAHGRRKPTGSGLCLQT